jgi:hypothetical protein
MQIVLPKAIDDFPLHRQRLIAACDVGAAESEVIGMAISGSFAYGTPDAYSDLDLRVVVADGSLDRVFERKEAFARRCGPLVAAFTGEHVGEPHLLITLYSDLIHVDYLFTDLAGAAERNEGRPVHVLWQREPAVTAALSRTPTLDPVADLTYMESRIWTWAWYIQSKILRGELWEAASGINFVRDVVIFRLFAVVNQERFRGARFAESVVGEHGSAVTRTLSGLDRQELLEALRTEVRLYREIGDPLLARYGVQPNQAARATVLAALGKGLDFVPPR